MQCLLLIYREERQVAKMPEAQRGKLIQQFLEFTQGIVKSGHFRAGSQLQPTSNATTIREKTLMANGGVVEVCPLVPTSQAAAIPPPR